MMKCPYCLKDIELLEEGSCLECKMEIDKVIIDNIKNTNFVSVAFVGERGVGKTSYLTSLFFLFVYDDTYIKSHKLLNEEAFETILNNVKLLKNNILPEATDLTFSQIPLVRLTLKNNSNYLVSFIDVAGEIYNNKEQLKINPQAQKVFMSDVIFWIIDGEKFFTDLLNNKSDVLDDLALINRYVNVKHEYNENKQKLVLIFTKIDKVYNLLYEHKELFECFRKTKNNDLYENAENIKQCSDNIKKFLKEKGLSNFVNSVEDEFKSVLFSLTSSFPKGDNKEFKYDKNTPINVIEPFVYDFYKIEFQKEKELELKKQRQLKRKKQIITFIIIIGFIFLFFILNKLFHPYEKYQEYQCQNGDIQICKEIKNYKKACELGDKQSCLKIGNYQKACEVGDVDSCLQIENYKKGCELGDKRSCNIVKCENNDKYACYEIGKYDKGCELGDLKSCIEIENYKKACELGDSKSCDIIKCENNDKYACRKIENYKKLCELGDKQSCLKIGNYYKVCELGDVDSCIQVGNYYKGCELGDLKSCIEIENYKKACELGDSKSCDIIKCENNDKYACKKIENYEKACELGDLKSCIQVGNYQKACSLEDLKSCFKIGNYKKACKLGDKRSCYKVGNYRKLCNSGDLKSCIKVENYKKACELGDVKSCLIMGDKYKNKNDLYLALKFYKKACHFGSYIDDCNKYKELKNKLSSRRKNELLQLY